MQCMFFQTATVDTVSNDLCRDPFWVFPSLTSITEIPITDGNLFIDDVAPFNQYENWKPLSQTTLRSLKTIL